MSAIEFNNQLLKNLECLKPFAGTLTRDNEDAKDLLQETLYRAWANKDKYQVGTNLKAWLHTIMRNIFINDYRRKSKQNTIVDNTPNNFLLDSGKTVSLNDGLRTLHMKELNDNINKLPVIFKTPFLLYFDGYMYNEIAELLQEPLGTIKSRIHFARKLLKAQTERY